MLPDDTRRNYLTTTEAEQHSGLSRNYLALLVRRGRIDGFRSGRDWHIAANSLNTFLSGPRKPGPRRTSRSSLLEKPSSS